MRFWCYFSITNKKLDRVTFWIILIQWTISMLWPISFLECTKVSFVWGPMSFWYYFPIKNIKLGCVTFLNNIVSVNHFPVMVNLFARMGQRPLYEPKGHTDVISCWNGPKSFVWAQRPFWWFLLKLNISKGWSLCHLQCLDRVSDRWWVSGFWWN